MDVYQKAIDDGSCEWVNTGTEKKPNMVLRHKENYRKFVEFCNAQPSLLDFILEEIKKKEDGSSD